MHKLIGYLLLGLFTLVLLDGLVPLLGALAHALVPLVLVISGVTVVGRLIWHFTNRY